MLVQVSPLSDTRVNYKETHSCLYVRLVQSEVTEQLQTRRSTVLAICEASSARGDQRFLELRRVCVGRAAIYGTRDDAFRRLLKASRTRYYSVSSTREHSSIKRAFEAKRRANWTRGWWWSRGEFSGPFSTAPCSYIPAQVASHASWASRADKHGETTQTIATAMSGIERLGLREGQTRPS